MASLDTPGKWKPSGDPLRWVFLIWLLFGTNGCQTTSQFYPIGIYSVPTANDLRLVREAGFNLVVGPAEKHYLDSARALGLKVLASPDTSAGARFDALAARRAVNRFDPHPALWAWYLIDEPDLNRVAPDDVLNANRFLKNIGARKPTALVIYQGYSALDYAGLSDILMVDRYPIPWLPLANFPQHVRMARLALGKKRPLMAVIQAFDWSVYPDLLPEEKNLRPPTYEELRCMTYCALAQRANGLFYYGYAPSHWAIREHPEVWESLKKVVREVNARLPLFKAEQIWWPYLHEFGDPTTRFNAALESSVTPARLRVRTGSPSIATGDYVLTVNNTAKNQRYKFLLPSPMSGTIPVLDEGRVVPIKRNWVEDEFAPFAVHIYGPVRSDRADIRARLP